MQSSERKTGVIENAVNFFRVSPQLHIPNLIIGPLATTYEYQLLIGSPVLGGIADEIISPFAWIGLGLVFINEIKALSNLLDYKRVRRALNKNGWDERIIEPMLYTWCGRYAARTAAIDEGFKSEIQQYYKDKGVTWMKTTD